MQDPSLIYKALEINPYLVSAHIDLCKIFMSAGKFEEAIAELKDDYFEIAVIPKRAVTVGMKECLSARKLRFYCNRPWQSAVVRRVLHGPITPVCPASFLRTHPDAQIGVANYVAEKPDIRLR